MKVLDVHPLKDGLHRNIVMLNRLGNEMETIHRAVQGLVAMEDSLKGEGGNAIRVFYADCHLPFLQFFKLFQSRFSYVLKQMDATLDGLEPDSSGFIREHFLDAEIDQGLKTIAQLTESLTEEANSIMNQVADIVALPHLDDSEVQEGVHTATIKRDTTLTQLHEFDANQTTALTPIEQDLLTMETWISDIEGLFTDGVTSINFSANQWATLSSKNTLKTDLAQHTAAMATLPVMMDVNGQPTTMLGALLAGEDQIEFSYGFMNGLSTLYGSSILTLPGMATQARPMDGLNGEISTVIEQVKALVPGSREFSLEESEIIEYLRSTNFDDPNRKSSVQKLPPYEGEITFEGMRKVVGGNGPGTPDGLAPYAVAAYDYFTEDIGTMLSADATAYERFEAATFTFFKPTKMFETGHDLLKVGEKTKDVGKVEGAEHVGRLKGKEVLLKDIIEKEVTYTKRDREEFKQLRNKFNSSARKNFLQDLVNEEKNLKQLFDAGLTDIDIKNLKSGLVPDGYQVHHKLPLDDGGTNGFENLILIKNDPYHKVLTNSQKELTKGMEVGDSININWPHPEGFIYPTTKK